MCVEPVSGASEKVAKAGSPILGRIIKNTGTDYKRKVRTGPGPEGDSYTQMEVSHKKVCQ